jgi:4-aminobutyrate aminotransferase
LVTLELLEREYIVNAAKRGEQLQAGLKALCEQHDILRAVRGIGLMTAIEIATPTLRNELVQACFQRGLLLLGCGESAIRFCPSLCVSAEQIATALAIFADAANSLATVAQSRALA